jgi:mono/diheme cytochrome c family protein
MSKPAIGAVVVVLLSLCSIVTGQGKQTSQSGAADSAKLIDSIQGPNLYKAYCAVCHGSDAKGGGPMATSLKKPPSDLTRISAKNGGMFPLATVRRIISGEDSVLGGHGTRQMPIWGPIFSQVARDQDLGRVRIDNLARYLESLQAK